MERSDRYAVRHWLEQQCKEKEFSRSELAHRMGYRNMPKALRRLDAFGEGQRVPPFDTMLAKGLGIELAELLASIEPLREKIESLEAQEAEASITAWDRGKVVWG